MYSGGAKRSRRSSRKSSKRSAKRSPRRSVRRSKKTKRSGKRAPSAYIKFMKRYFANHKGQDVKKTMKQGAGEWRRMSDAEKARHR